MKDEMIVELYWKRDEAALVQTEVKYGAYLMKVTSNILSDPLDCEECVNDTYLAAWNSMPVNRPKVLSTYLGKIARQRSIDIFRKNQSKKRYMSQFALSLDEIGECFTDGGTSEQALNMNLLVEEINEFLHSVGPKERTAFIGRYYYFDSVKEIAQYCGMREAAVKSMLFRTRQKLKEHLLKQGFEL